ncbi:hypothetical protein GGR52DRAFT_565590 [Hypoxylon sp. FL1284]|nr:hypothetical protein GGR52DRAFT_565590 [Hypoxylon sp. FL1284]
MTSDSSKLYFRFLAALAVALLWGISLINGTVKALLLAVWRGQMTDQIPLKTNYTGIAILDYPIAVLVAFFFHGTDGSEEGYQLFLVDAYSTLQSAFVWLYIETLRPGNGHKWIQRPIIFGLLWQCFGAAISLPLYYAVHVSSGAIHGASANARHLHKARAIPFSFLLGAIVPAVIGMAPTWQEPESRSPTTHQTILAAWQPDPVWVSLIQASLAWIFSQFPSRGDEKPKVYACIRSSYLLGALSSATGHLYTVARVMSSENEGTNFWRMYVPFPGLLNGPSGVSGILIRGPWLFLQYDLIIIGLSSLSWAYYLLSQTRGLSGTGLMLAMLVGAVTIGPGATVSLALYAREKSLFESGRA